MTDQDPLLHDRLATDDFELVKASDPEPPVEPSVEPPRRSPQLWMAAAALVVVVLIVAGYLFSRPRPAPAPVAATPPPVEQPRALEPVPATTLVPPLDDSDAFVRQLVTTLSSHPAIAAWLTTDGLIRNFTVAVVSIAEGNTPAKDLKVLRPPSSFAVMERGDDLVIDPRSYQRYDALAAAAASVDAESTARLFATLKPRLDEANEELGLSAQPFDRTLERAIILLLQTPIVNDPVRIEPHGIGYGFADSRLEDLAPSQKQLLRMGSRNVRTVQSSLRSIALALGIPAARLPPPSI
jgi:hypothetical protein